MHYFLRKIKENIEKILLDNYFAAKTIQDILVHELTHKMHWNSAKVFYNKYQKRYNTIEEAMNELNSSLVLYVKQQMQSDYKYLLSISENATMAFHRGKHK